MPTMKMHFPGTPLVALYSIRERPHKSRSRNEKTFFRRGSLSLSCTHIPTLLRLYTFSWGCTHHPRVHVLQLLHWSLSASVGIDLYVMMCRGIRAIFVCVCYAMHTKNYTVQSDKMFCFRTFFAYIICIMYKLYTFSAFMRKYICIVDTHMGIQQLCWRFFFLPYSGFIEVF